MLCIMYVYVNYVVVSSKAFYRFDNCIGRTTIITYMYLVLDSRNNYIHIKYFNANNSARSSLPIIKMLKARVTFEEIISTKIN